MTAQAPPMTIAKIQRAIVSKEMLPSEALRPFLDRATRFDGRIRSLVTSTAVTAMERAEIADQDIKIGRAPEPLTGVPYTLKDIINTASVRTTANSRSLAGNVPMMDAVVHGKLMAAGGILVGKAATWEFAHGGPSWDVLQDPARNPWDISRDPSGSSSGSAAGIAAGLCAASIGSDTGGSIRGPSSACGTVGLKPTNGLVSVRGVIPNSFSLDCVGPMAWTAEDVAIVLEALTIRPDSKSASGAYTRNLDRSLNGLRIGVPYAWLDRERPPSNEVRAAFDAALRLLEGLGATVRSAVDLSPLRLFEDTKKTIAAVELFTTHAGTLRSRPELLGECFRVRIAAGAFVTAEEYLNAHRWRHRLALEMQAIFEDFDVLMLPTGEPAGPLKPTLPESLLTNLNFHSAFNVSGNPALATRMGFNGEGMPLSIQIVGRHFAEARVLNVAHVYERETDWGDHRPTAMTRDQDEGSSPELRL